MYIPRKILTPSKKASRNTMKISMPRVAPMSGYGKSVPIIKIKPVSKSF